MINTAKNKMDAITAATQSSHETRTYPWKRNNVSAVVVADGTSTVKLELNAGKAKLATHTFAVSITNSAGILSGTVHLQVY